MEPARIEERPFLVIERRYPVAPEKVWRAWTDPQAISRWWGPGGGEKVSLAELDLRVGGRYRIIFGGADGNAHEVQGVYKEIVPGRRLVFTWTWPRTTPERESLVTITLTQVGQGTELAFRHEQFFDQAARDGHQRGWGYSFANLKRFLQETEPFVIERLFDAPRNKLWKAWTEAGQLRHWWGPKGFTVMHCTIDLRPGGAMHYCLRTPDGQDMWGRFVYREIVEPERLVWVNSFSDASGGITVHPMMPTWPRQMLSTALFEALGARTRLTIRWIPLEGSSELEWKTFDEGRDSMKQGWGGTFEQFAEYLARA